MWKFYELTSGLVLRCHRYRRDVPDSLPLVIVGSRLQAISILAISLALVVGLAADQPWVIAPALAGAVFAITRLIFRVELGERDVSVRQWRGTTIIERTAVNAELGHRYLALSGGTLKRMRIEVPVEIRPQVRRWVGAESDA